MALTLNGTNSEINDATYFNSRASDSASVFTLGSHASSNFLNDNYIAYLFASVEGFSKAFSYTGNSSTDGPLVYCGFRPRFIMVKCTTFARDWHIIDTTRATYNVMDAYLEPNTTQVETNLGHTSVDALANGFKWRTTNGTVNGAQTYVGIAFAETPLKYANAR
jgi:hypothetical protein